MVLRKCFYIRWSAGISPRVHEVNPGWDPSILFYRYRERSRGRLVLETEVVKKAGLWL